MPPPTPIARDSLDIALNCPSCASCDPSDPGCVAPAAWSAGAAPSSAGARDRTKLVVAIAVPVGVVLLCVVAFFAYRMRLRRLRRKHEPPAPAQPSSQMNEVKTKGSMKSVGSGGTDGQSSGTHISTLPPYSPARANSPPSAAAIRGPEGAPTRPPPLPPRREIEENVCVGHPEVEDECEDDASSTSSFGALGPPPFEFDTAFTLTHRSLSPVPEERESMTTRNSSYTMGSDFDDVPASRSTMCSTRSAAQHFRDLTLSHRVPPPVATPPPPPPSASAPSSGGGFGDGHAGPYPTL